MNKTVKTLLTIAVASLMLVACDKKDANAEKKASTIEEIQKEKGKPARVVKAATSKLTDVRKFSGTIEGINQNSAICKMGDPIAKSKPKNKSLFLKRRPNACVNSMQRAVSASRIWIRRKCSSKLLR